MNQAATPTPQVSVIIPVHNTAAYLRECLDSVLNQTGVDLEIVAVNDASPDDSAAILREYAARDGRVRVLDLAQNVGQGFARNRGMEAATGTWIAFLDSDDAMFEGALSRMVETGEKFGSEIVVGSSTVRLDVGSQTKILRDVFDPHLDLDIGATNLDEFFTLINVPACWSSIYRRDFLSQGDVRFQRAFQEDHDFVVHAFLEASRITLAGSIRYVIYRKRDSLLNKSITQQTWGLDRGNMLLSHFERLVFLLGQEKYRQRLRNLDALRVWRLSYMVGNFLENVLPDMMRNNADTDEFLGRLAACMASTGLIETGLDLRPPQFTKRPALAADGFHDMMLALAVDGEWRLIRSLLLDRTFPANDLARLTLGPGSLGNVTSARVKNFVRLHPEFAGKLQSEHERLVPRGIRRIVLHIGMTKTGSTALQNFLLLNHDNLLARKIMFPRSGIVYHGKAGAFRTDGHGGVMRYANLGERAFFTELASELASAGDVDTLVLSAENLFHYCAEQGLPKLRRAFGSAEVRIVAFVRRQDDWLNSFYGEAISGGHLKTTSDFDGFVESRKASGELDYDAILRRWEKVFGAENVKIAGYRPGHTIEDFFELAEIGSMDGLSPIEDSHANRSALSKESLMLFRAMNALPFGGSKEVYRSFATNFRRRYAEDENGAVEWWQPGGRTALLSDVQSANERLVQRMALGAATFAPAPERGFQGAGEDGASISLDRLEETLALYRDELRFAGLYSDGPVAQKPADRGQAEIAPWWHGRLPPRDFGKLGPWLRVRTAKLFSPGLPEQQVEELLYDPALFFRRSRYRIIRALAYLT